MQKTITAFLRYTGDEDNLKLIKSLSDEVLVEKICLFSEKVEEVGGGKCKVISDSNLFAAGGIKKAAECADTAYSLLITTTDELIPGKFALERFVETAEDTGAGWIYSDFYEASGENVKRHPVIDYQRGSLRDDFNFGKMIFLDTKALKEAASRTSDKFDFAGLYDLRLKISQKYQLFRLPEYLYTYRESDKRKSGEKLFDYVNPANRKVQIEMEEAVTDHLKDIGAYLEPKFDLVKDNNNGFKFEASVIIPVKNRVKTITDAMESVLKQKTSFPFNLIVVDNHSDDGTTEKIKAIAEKDERVIHIIPERTDLQIGGCWNEAVHHDKCGKYSVQLDSDDIYYNEDTISKVVEKFREEKCAMIVGSYKLTDFELNEIPPGLIDHREWTPENGRNNALRINGLGAPRAFYTPVLRENKIPNVSYGEDYALGLKISRNYQIGRIYEPIYLCRRWDGNSDAALDVVKLNNNNLYKDRVRTIELLARERKNKKNA